VRIKVENRWVLSRKCSLMVIGTKLTLRKRVFRFICVRWKLIFWWRGETQGICRIFPEGSRSIPPLQALQYDRVALRRIFVLLTFILNFSATPPRCFWGCLVHPFWWLPWVTRGRKQTCMRGETGFVGFRGVFNCRGRKVWVMKKIPGKPVGCSSWVLAEPDT
jgi:hypothetical protein